MTKPEITARLPEPIRRGISPGRRLTKAALWIVLFALWTLMLLLIDPRGEFPLNDDWSYARAVKNLHDSGSLAFPVDWASMTLVAHVLWGWLVTSLFGFSFFVLRIGNLVPAAAGIVGVYALLREARVSRQAAFVAAAATAFNPWYVQLSLSFMTDVPFLAATLWSFVFLLRALRERSRADFWIGLGLSLIATMIRQHGIFIAGAWMVTYLWQVRDKPNRSILKAVLPLIAHVIYLGVHQLALGPVLGAHSTVPEVHHWGELVGTRGWSAAVWELWGRGAAILVYAGVLALPVWIFSLFERRVRASRAMIAAGVAAILIPLLWRPYVPRPFDIVYNLGLGPPTLRDVYLLGLPNLPSAPKGFWIAFTTAGIFGGAILLVRWVQWVRNILSKREADGALTLLTVFSAGCLVLVPLMPFLDRHVLLLLPLLWILTARRESEQRKHTGTGMTVALTFVAATAIFSTAGLHDYFAWNRARWAALEWLTTTQDVRPEQVDGGFEYHGWNTFDPNYHPQPDKSWWWVKDDEYLIAFGRVPDYDVQAQYPYAAWLPPGQRAICVLHRADIPVPSLTK